MVENHTDQARRLLVLKPNKSMSWQSNKNILLAMFVVNMVIGISFAMLGAWLILPFAGLEVLLVGVGMYYVCWKLNFQETIALECDEVQLKKGVYYPKEAWRWQMQNMQLLLQPSKYRLSPPALYLRHLDETIEIGSFLNREEKQRLREALREWGVPIVMLPKQ